MSVSYAGKPDIDADIFKSIMCLLHFLETITFQKLNGKETGRNCFHLELYCKQTSAFIDQDQCALFVALL